MESLWSLKALLREARKHKYAVPGFDCVTDVYIRAILDAAQAAQSPIILMALGHDLQGRGMHYIAGLVQAVAPHYDIPVALHLDHATDLDLIRRGIDHGFSSVMFDGSMLSDEENLARTQEVVALAQPHGVSVEAELGCVAGTKITGEDIGENRLTRPEEVVDFARATAVDALAVSIGTHHGVYASRPELDIGLLEAINAVSPVPLVLHGGSGTPADQVQRAIRSGITKLNVYADTRLALNAALPQALTLVERRADELSDVVFRPLYEAVFRLVQAKIQVTMSGERAQPVSP
jgi:fructose-bisphosphate aldolase class II